MRIGPGTPRDFFLPDDEMQNLPEGSLPKKARSEKDSWQMAHMEYYETASVPWPASISSMGCMTEHCSHLSERELEVLVLAHTVFPAPTRSAKDKGIIECIDVNDEIKRHFGPLNLAKGEELKAKDRKDTKDKK